MVTAAVAPWSDDQALWIVEGHKPRERAFGSSRIEPARPALDRDLRPLELPAKAESAEVVHREVPAFRPVVAESDFLARFVNAGILLMIAHGGFEQLAVFVVIDRTHADGRIAALYVAVHGRDGITPFASHKVVEQPARHRQL